MSVPFLIYVAGPYTPKEIPPGPEAEAIKVERFNALTLAAAMLRHCKKWNAFSPITHSHPMHVQAGLRGDWEFWKRIDAEYVNASERLVIVTLDGWGTSTGVSAETQIANEGNIPVWHMTEPICVRVGNKMHCTAWLTDNHTGEFLSYDYDITA